MRKQIKVLKPTNDDWYGNLKVKEGTNEEVKLVEVSLFRLGPDTTVDDWRVFVKGTDDYAMYMDFHNYSTALNTFIHVITPPAVDIKDLRVIGFVVY